MSSLGRTTLDTLVRRIWKCGRAIGVLDAEHALDKIGDVFRDTQFTLATARHPCLVFDLLDAGTEGLLVLGHGAAKEDAAPGAVDGHHDQAEMARKIGDFLEILRRRTMLRFIFLARENSARERFQAERRALAHPHRNIEAFRLGRMAERHRVGDGTGPLPAIVLRLS